MGDLKKWVDQKWVDIGAPKKDGKYQPCGRKSASVPSESIQSACHLQKPHG